MSFQLESISKRLGTSTVLSDISLQFTVGEPTLVLGRNGAGKSTLLKVCAGLMRPDTGRLCIDDKPIGRIPLSRVGYVSHLPMLYAELTVAENLELASRLRHCALQCDEYLNSWELLSYSRHRISQLSKGLQARACVAQALLHHPKYVFLDEPTSALDDLSTDNLLHRLAELKASVIVIASHDLARVTSYCRRIVLLEAGSVAADSSAGMCAEEVMQRYRRVNR